MTDALRLLAFSARFLEALNCGALVIDRQGRITRANTRFGQMMRRPVTELLGRTLLDFYKDPARGPFILEPPWRFDEPWEGEFVLPLPDGSPLPVIISARVLGDEPP